MDNTRFCRFALLLRDMTEAELEAQIKRPRRLLLDTDMAGKRHIEIAYFPVGPVNVDAQVVIVGLTPGRTQMRNALKEARRCLRARCSEVDTLAAVKVVASFSGPMRPKLVDMLDSIGVNGLLGLQSTASLWDGDGHNYSGTPSMFSTPLLRKQLTGFAAQAATLRQAIFVPVGSKAGAAVEFAAGEIGLDRNRVLVGLPHPSGANNERIAFFLGRKARRALSAQVDRKS
jgi:hypothetical protein